MYNNPYPWILLSSPLKRKHLVEPIALVSDWVFWSRETRLLGFSVRHDPEPEHEAHSLIEGANDREKCRRLAEATRILVQPAGS